MRKVNYRINHVEGQAETSFRVLHACMNIFHFWLTQYVTRAVCREIETKEKKEGKKSTLLNWCTTHVSASWLEREIRRMCRKNMLSATVLTFFLSFTAQSLWTNQSWGYCVEWKSTQHWGVSNHVNNKLQTAFSASLSSYVMCVAPTLLNISIFLQLLS